MLLWRFTLVRGRSRSRLRTLTWLLITIVLVVPKIAEAQQFYTLHTFDSSKYGFDAADGASPRAGLTMDNSGNMYGVTFSGGHIGGFCGPEPIYGCGTVFVLANTGHDF